MKKRLDNFLSKKDSDGEPIFLWVILGILNIISLYFTILFYSECFNSITIFFAVILTGILIFVIGILIYAYKTNKYC